MPAFTLTDYAYRVTSRDEARSLGLVYYFTGHPCRRGHRADRLVSTKNCTVCNRDYKVANRAQLNADFRRRWVLLSPEQKRHKNKWSREYIARRPALKLLFAARARAKEQGVPFDLVEADIVIPECCPVLGIPLARGRGKLHDGSPTVDRLVPLLGYVRGNICVISHRANRIKQNATVEELEAVVRWLRDL